MLIKDQSANVREIETADDLAETRLEATGFVFHGHLPGPDGKRPRARAGVNLLHFARCAKLDRAGGNEAKFWFRTIRVAKAHLDEHVGPDHWKWCKLCEREITQKILNEQ
jgi:hypothetical protein